jgi:DNA primase
MRFSQEFLDELRARLPVSDVVGRRVKLKKSGREWKGLSPFQQEKTPSFFVNDQKQAWFDFSSCRCPQPAPMPRGMSSAAGHSTT